MAESMKRFGVDPNAQDEGQLHIAQFLLDHLDAMVAYWDVNEVCVYANNAYRLWFGKNKEQVIGHTLRELLGPIYPLNAPHIRAALEGQLQVFERDIPAPGGAVRHSLATYTPHLVNGKVVGFFVHVADVTPLKDLERQLKAAKEKAEQLATHDFLTGLPNRVLLFDRISQALALLRRKQQMVALLHIDIDDFKKVNDTHGHGVGDRLLIEFASRMKGALRESDTLTRMGGDEFLLLGPEVDSAAQAETIASHVLGRIRHPFQLGELDVAITVSVGIALSPRDGTTAEALIAGSDRALYIAKGLGKNRFAFAEPSVPAG
jgi:diguanylate cyclase (GGDEF)-like protein/PAS domain S-box-containing protein